MCASLRIMCEGVCIAMPPLTTSDKFVIRVVKALAASPLNEWANSYEFQADDPVGTGDLNVLASAIIEFEKQIHNEAVSFHRALVSTWAADSVPYNPLTFLTIPIVGGGLATTTAQLVALNTCFQVARRPETGRIGHLFYRGVLDEDQVEAPAGISVLTSPSAMDTIVTTALADSELEGYIGSTPAGPLHMVMINKDGTQIRNVISLDAQGVTTLPTDHAWFNRTETVSP